MFSIESKTEAQTIKLGKNLAKSLKPGDIVCLYGDLGTGKTTLVKGIAEGLKIKQDAVHSPTFVLMNVYEGKLPIYHFDFYRLDRVEEIQLIGFDEFLYGKGVSVIEWADRLNGLTPQDFLKVELKNKNHHRMIQVSAE